MGDISYNGIPDDDRLRIMGDLHKAQGLGHVLPSTEEIVAQYTSEQADKEQTK